MEGMKDIRKVGIMALVVMVVYAGQASASFKGCFEPCFVACEASSGNTFSCGFKCFKQCLFKPVSISDAPQYYCRVGCFLNQCARHSHDSDQVKSCVDNCSSNVCAQA